jgi:hypothetical protein
MARKRKKKRSAFRGDHEALNKFITNYVGVMLTPFQQRMMRAIWKSRRAAIASGHGMGKGYAGGLAVLGFCMLNPEPMAVITAPTGRQAKRTLWSELRAHHETLSGRTIEIDGAQMKIELNGHTLNETEWKIQRARQRLVRTVALHYSVRPSEQTSFQGIHSPQLLVLIDEAAGVDDRIVKAAETLATGRDNKVVLSGNPTNPGAFERAFQVGSGWETVSASCFEHPNVLKNEEIVPGAVTREFIDDMWNDMGDGVRIRWPEGEIKSLDIWPEWQRLSTWQNVWWMGHVMGLFPPEGDDNLLKYGDVMKAMRADHGGAGPFTLGVDVARYGKDKTVLVVAGRKDVIAVLAYPKTSGPDVVGLVHKVAKEYGVAPEDVRIDATGIGGMGVADWLDAADGLSATERSMWGGVEEVEFGASSHDSGRFLNMKAELMWRMKEKIERGEVGMARVSGRAKKALEQQLRSLKFEFRGTRIAIEPKDEYRKRTGGSPDEAEALALALIPSESALSADDDDSKTGAALEELERAGFSAVGLVSGTSFFEDEDDLEARLEALLDN